MRPATITLTVTLSLAAAGVAGCRCLVRANPDYQHDDSGALTDSGGADTGTDAQADGTVDAALDSAVDAGTDAGPPLADYYVDPDAPPGGNGSQAMPFMDIMDGLAQCTGSQTTIALAAGTYPGVTLPPNCTLWGVGSATTIIDASGLGRAVDVPDGGVPGGGLVDLAVIGGNVMGPGAGVNVAAGSFTLAGVRVEINIASDRGGGVRVMDAEMFTVVDTTFLQNSSSASMGGGLYVEATTFVMLSNTLFMANTADSHGGGAYLKSVTASLVDVSFSGNMSTGGSGGGLYLESLSPSTVAGGAIESNTPSSPGGGVYMKSGSITVNGVRIAGNISTNGDGGGWYLENGTLDVTNSFIVSNTSSGDGAGLFFAGGAPDLVHVTVANNDSTAGVGAGVFCGGLGAHRNTIVWGNTASGSPEGASGCAFTYSDLQDLDPGMGNISMSPMFASVVMGDFHIQPGSPCVDTGDPAAGVFFDFDGDMRDTMPDIGADEVP